jgi:hypothetical protein
MLGKISRAGLVGLLLLFFIAIPFVACAAEKKPPAVTPAPVAQKAQVIKIGDMEDLTSGVYSWCPYQLQGRKDYAEKVNRAGGIDGVPIEVLWADCKQDAALALSAYKRFKAENVLLIHCVSSVYVSAIMANAEEDRIALNCNAGPLGSYFPKSSPVVYTQWNNDVKNSISAIDTFKNLWKKSHTGPLKLGILMWEHPLFIPSQPSVDAYCKDVGIELVGRERAPVTALEFKTELRRLKDKGANAIYIGMVTPRSWKVLADMGELGLLPGLEITGTGEYVWHEDGITPLLPTCAFSPEGWEIAGKWAQYCWGEIVITPFQLVDLEKSPNVKEMIDAMTVKYDKKSIIRNNIEYTYGWYGQRMAIDALKRAAEAVGVEKLTGEALCKRGLEGLFLPGNDLYYSPLDFSAYPNDHGAIDQVRYGDFDTKLGCQRPWGELTINYDKFCYDNGYYPGVPGTKVK